MTPRRTVFDENRDRQIADEVNADRQTMCKAPGCPSRWSVDFGTGRLCSVHSRADRRDWDRVTQDIHQFLAAPKPPKPAEHRYTLAEKRDILARLSDIGARSHVHQGHSPAAYALQSLETWEERHGARMTPAQRDFREHLSRWLGRFDSTTGVDNG
jgi:hypothetical protein